MRVGSIVSGAPTLEGDRWEGSSILSRNAEVAPAADRDGLPQVGGTVGGPSGPIGGIRSGEREGVPDVATASTRCQHRAWVAGSTAVILGAWLLAALLLGGAAVVFGH